MKKIAIFSGIFALLVGAVVAYVYYMLPSIDVKEVKVANSAEQIERGKYLAEHVAVCNDCHSQRDWSLLSAPIKESTKGGGGEIFGKKKGFPGEYVASNITPAALGKWTDGEIIRAITAGVSKDGRALFPIMPYPNYGMMDEADIHSIVAYMRQLKAVNNTMPPSISNFPMNIIINMIPREAKFTTRPSETDGVKYGEYLVQMASCVDCHTKLDGGKKIEGMEFAGGQENILPDGSIVRSSNITPHQTSGIGIWTKEIFIARFKEFEKQKTEPTTVESGKFNTHMPWVSYSGMTEADLAAMFEYLSVLKPVDHVFERFTPSK